MVSRNYAIKEEVLLGVGVESRVTEKFNLLLPTMKVLYHHDPVWAYHRYLVTSDEDKTHEFFRLLSVGDIEGALA